ncbi:bacillithiol system redox-active protein YtxJ [Fictibacillus fluitans]|uniref:Bacillithiol system redox-active protein YtxJ n=1 Tax=Fictibacillus fluitans TaxID=3058422 RepID=A0ABT8I0L5_9BACL|nr:bacillithiol system redox-active protein YtxJ [Fictibacillus sp. NE201]MDN4526582.1 bacillithiol system redox-active protein YtxJ [Fictibacillus sp. NE201]
MSLVKISSSEEFEQAIRENDQLFLMKNSTTCPISHAAFQEYQKFAAEQDTPVFYLNVQEARPLSNEIAEKFGVRHESPQALLFEKGEVKWNASHYSITSAALSEQLGK